MLRTMDKIKGKTQFPDIAKMFESCFGIWLWLYAPLHLLLYIWSNGNSIWGARVFWCFWWWHRNCKHLQRNNPFCCLLDIVFIGFLTMTTFRKSSRFWGVKYTIPNFHHLLPFSLLSKCNSNIYTQQNGWELHSGLWVDLNVPFNAGCNKANCLLLEASKFRCFLCLYRNTSLQWTDLKVHPKTNSVAYTCAIQIHIANWQVKSMFFMF